MFSGASNVDSYSSGKEVVSIKLPPLSSKGSRQADDSDEPVEPIVTHLQSKDASASAFLSQDQQIPDLVTLSLLPKSQWQSLINLDIIKVFLCLHSLLFSVYVDSLYAKNKKYNNFHL
jgi:U3 small nucleolar RNA-associated protein 21